MTKEQLLAEVEDLLRTIPPRATIHQETELNFSWLGRVAAVIGLWDLGKGVLMGSYLREFHSRLTVTSDNGFLNMMTMLHQARHDLRMQTVGPMSVAVGHGMVFDYFDEIRKIVEGANKDLFFVDPYLDADFVSRYLVHVAAGVGLRLLTREKLATLLPAVTAFVQQSNTRIEVRSATNFHDRYVLADGTACYQSGASFKDGAKTPPTTLTQITDALAVVSQTYEAIWSRGKVEPC